MSLSDKFGKVAFAIHHGDNMRYNLIAFIRAVQEQARNDTPNQLRTHLALGNAQGQLWFGYGYFDVNKVLWWPPATEEDKHPPSVEMETEAGVDCFMQSYGLKEPQTASDDAPKGE